VRILLNERAKEIRWSAGSCGNPGCKDPECVCALCASPIGIPDDDPSHDPECGGCAVCEDQVALIIFRGSGKKMVQAAFHAKCFHDVTIHEFPAAG
jgi:hypothetical protein